MTIFDVLLFVKLNLCHKGWIYSIYFKGCFSNMSHTNTHILAKKKHSKASNKIFDSYTRIHYFFPLHQPIYS